MSPATQNPAPRPSIPLRAVRAVVIMLAGSLITMIAAVVFLRLTSRTVQDPDTGTLLAIFALILGAISVIPLLRLRSYFRAQAAARAEQTQADLQKEQVPTPLYSYTIMTAAVFEGVGLTGTIAMFLGAPWWGLILPVVCAAAILFQVPSKHTLTNAMR